MVHKSSGRIAAQLAVVVAVSVLTGCGYSLAGRGSFLPAYINSIAVLPFANNTPVFEVDRKVTEKVRAELISRGRYKVRDERVGSDAVLIGEILAVTLTPAAFNADNQVTRYTLTLVVKAEFRDLKTDKILWSTPGMTFSEQYDITSSTGALDVTTFLGQDVNALERLSIEFARALISAILEAF